MCISFWVKQRSLSWLRAHILFILVFTFIFVTLLNSNMLLNCQIYNKTVYMKISALKTK